ncbi:hypothetical protein LP414_27430 [Polaromonas sp. P1(28)-13]|nr:hypothetical protein LP414_27430 [Polaromonas sp. P1(28)-13]
MAEDGRVETLGFGLFGDRAVEVECEPRSGPFRYGRSPREAWPQPANIMRNFFIGGCPFKTGLETVFAGDQGADDEQGGDKRSDAHQDPDGDATDSTWLAKVARFGDQVNQPVGDRKDDQKDQGDAKKHVKGSLFMCVGHC